MITRALGAGAPAAWVGGDEVRAALQRAKTAPRTPAPATTAHHPVADLSRQRIKRRPVLGGLLNEYERAA